MTLCEPEINLVDFQNRVPGHVGAGQLLGAKFVLDEDGQKEKYDDPEMLAF